MSTDGSDKSRVVALVLAALLGVFGAHRFYVGKTGTAILMLLTFGGLGIWYLVDVILIGAGSFRDAEGRRLIHWTEDEAIAAGAGRPTGEIPEAVWQELETLRADMTELEERVDFAERLLTRARKSDEFDTTP
jgi:hypothetical protein